MKKIALYNILVALYSSIFLVNELYTIDRLGPQTFVLSILNLICLLILFSRKQKESIETFNYKLILNSIQFYYVLIFISMILFSFNAVNTSEAIITLNHYFNVFLSFYCLLNLLREIKNAKIFVTYLVLASLILESGYIFYKILEYYHMGNFWLGGFNRNFYIRGFTGNINISAFSLAYKLPFLFYYIIYKENGFWKKIFLSFLTVITIINISHLSSRGAILAFLMTSLSFIILCIKRKNLVLLIISIIIGSSLSFLGLRNSDNLNPIERTQSIGLNTKDGSVDQRLRYYSEVFDYLFDHSFKPIGIGMYKLFSVDFEKDYITQYRVPYHTHNDFFEILIENGILAFLSYFMIFILLIKDSLINFFRNKSYIHLALLLFFMIYFLDSSLNFPIARPVSFLFFNLITALAINLKSEKS